MNDETTPLVVYDTGCILQAVLNPKGPAADALELVDRDQVTAYISHRLRSEIEIVLLRPSIRAKNPLVTDAQIDASLSRLDVKAVMVPNPPPYVNYPRDPNDEPVINLAIHIEADYVVTRDRDLLDLVDERRPEGRYFRKRFPNITILDPVAFLQAIRARRTDPKGL